MEGIRIETVKTFMGNIENTMAMEDGEEKGVLKEFKVLKKDDAGNPAQVFALTKFPLMSEREMLADFKITYLPDGSV